MPVFRDRVKDTSTSTGTGNFTLSGTAPTGYQSFATAFAVDPSVLFLYCIVDNTSGQWETGTGYLSASTTLVRTDPPFDGSSGQNTLVNFSAGTKDVFCTATGHFLEDIDTGAMLHRSMGWAMP
jgi:hypothetical protein